MRYVYVFLLALGLASIFVYNGQAQASDTIWLTVSNPAYKIGETVTVTVNATAGTPVQGFTFQIRYDPACLTPMNAASPVPGMNGLPLPQISGLVDGTYASTSPQVVNGVLSEVYFQALADCQTNVTLESAALAIRNADGLAAPLPNVAITTNNVALNIDEETGVVQPIQPIGSSLPLEPIKTETTNYLNYFWVSVLLAVLLTIIAGSMLVIGLWKGKRSAKPAGKKRKNGLQGNNGNLPSRPVSNQNEHYLKKIMSSSAVAKVHFKYGPYAGKSFTLNRLPFSIGRDPGNDLCLNNSQIMGRHARISETGSSYYLTDLGGETYVNGQVVNKNSARLKSGDVVQLGQNALFVFESWR